MPPDKEKSYNPTVNFLRILSILGVIFIHTTTLTLEYSHYDIPRLSFSLFLNQIFRFAVPMFFLISGFVLEVNYKNKINIISYFKKRASRIILPYIFWSIIYYIFVFTKFNHSLFSYKFIDVLLKGEASYQLYFIPSLIIFYALFPFIHSFLNLIANKWIVIFLTIIQIRLLNYDYYHSPFLLDMPLRIALLNIYMFAIGMIASHNQEKILGFINSRKLLFTFFTVITAAFAYVESKNLYLAKYNIYYFYSQWKPLIFIYTILLSGLLFTLNFKEKLSRFINFISKLSFFVFFAHVLVIFLYRNILGDFLYSKSSEMVRNLWYDPALFVAVTLISFLFAYIAHLIPKLRIVTG